MNDLPWFYSLFNTELLKQKTEELTKEAEELGMTLEEYLQYKKNKDVPLCHTAHLVCGQG